MIMKKINFIVICAVAALSLAACAKEQLFNETTDSEGVERLIGAVTEPICKTSMAAPGESTSVPVLWSEGDIIGVVVKGTTTIRKATLTSGAGTTKGVFSVTGASSGEQYSYAIYPYAYGGGGGSTAPTVSGDVFSVTLPNRQPFATTDGKFDATKVFAQDINTMVGKFKGDNVDFYSVCGIIEIPCEKSSDALKNMWSVNLSSDTQKLSGVGTIDMTASDPVFVPGTATTTFNSVYKAATSDVKETAFPANADDYSIFFVVPRQTYDKLTIATYFTTPATATIRKSTKPHTVGRNTILRLPKYNPSTYNAEIKEGAIDLNVNGEKTEYSNCYMVPVSNEEKAYKFKMYYADNEEETNHKTMKYITGGSAFTMSTINMAYAYPVWETFDGFITKIFREGDDLYFAVAPGKGGNALINTITTTNSERQTFWHIWATNAQDQVLPGGETWLNCNLGATYAPATKADMDAMTSEQIASSMGLFYQWGTPKPHPGIDVSTAAAYGSNGYALHRLIPNQYAINWTGSATITNCLFTYGNYFYAGKKGVYNEYASGKVSIPVLEHTTGEDVLWSGGVKTMFDPCPVGYKVPSTDQMSMAFTNGIEGFNDKTYQKSNAKGGSYLEGTLESGENYFIFAPWCGLRMPCGVAVFDGGTLTTNQIGNSANHYATNYPRFYWWFAGDFMEASDIENFSTANRIRYGGGKAGQDCPKDKAVPGSYLPVVYFESTAKTTAGWETTVNNPEIVNQNYLMAATGASVRCVKIAE